MKRMTSEGALLLSIMELAEAIEIPQVNGVFLREGPRAATTGTICVAGKSIFTCFHDENRFFSSVFDSISFQIATVSIQLSLKTLGKCVSSSEQ